MWIPSRPLKRQIWTFRLKNLEKPPGKDSTEKHILLNFVKLSTIPCLLYLRKYTFISKLHFLLNLQSLQVFRGVAKKFLESDSWSSKMSATMSTMVGRRRRTFWVKEQLKRYISYLFQWDITYSKLSFLPHNCSFYLISWLRYE